MLANTVLKQLNSVEREDVCLWAENIQSTIVFDLHFQCFSSEKLYVASDLNTKIHPTLCYSLLVRCSTFQHFCSVVHI